MRAQKNYINEFEDHLLSTNSAKEILISNLLTSIHFNISYHLCKKERYELMKCKEQDDCLLSMKILAALLILLTLFVESLSFVVVPRFFQQQIARLTMTADTIMDCLEAQVRITNILIYDIVEIQITIMA